MARVATEKVAQGMSVSHGFAEEAWALVQDYINEYSYTLGISGTYNAEIEFDPNLTMKPWTAVLPEAPDFPEAPDINDDYVMPDIPSRPEISMPSAPTLADHQIPDFTSDITIPEFTETLPEVDVEPIQEADVIAMFGFITGDYTPRISELLAILMDRIVNGGTGLPADVEEDIWDRNLERDEQALQDSVDAIAAQWSKMNFSLPDGALANELLALNNNYNNNRQTTSREISIKQAELEQTNINESLKLYAAIEQAFNTVIVQYISAASDAMRAAVETSVSIYNSVVQYYRLLIEMYLAKLSKYKELITARMADVEVYKALIEGTVAAIAADDNKVKLYVAQIEAQDTKLKAYETELRGTLAQIEIIKAWLDVGKTRMELFSAETSALVNRYNAQLDGFKTEALAWTAENDTMIKEKDISLRSQVAVIESDLRVAEIQQNHWKAAIDADIQKMSTLTQVAAQIVAGALAAAHVSASVSDQDSTSESHQYNYQG